MKTFMIYWYTWNPYGDMCGSFFRDANSKEEAEVIATEDLSDVWSNRKKLKLTIIDVSDYYGTIEDLKLKSIEYKELMYSILETLLEKERCN